MPTYRIVGKLEVSFTAEGSSTNTTDVDLEIEADSEKEAIELAEAQAADECETPSYFDVEWEVDGSQWLRKGPTVEQIEDTPERIHAINSRRAFAEMQAMGVPPLFPLKGATP